MIKYGLTLLAVAGIFIPALACSAPADFAKYYEIDMNEKLPPYQEMYEKHIANYKVVDRGYDYHWDIGNMFSQIFRLTITSYGQTEKRIKNANEESLINLLKLLPPEYYQYVGPHLHTVPNMSDKILNMPGIKETKNQFPKRIAKQLEGIEDLEFLSPYLYYVLMPEVWPEYRQTMEKVPTQPVSAKVKHDPAFFAKIKALVPEDEFLPNAPKETKVGMSDLRTLEPTKDSPLTSADVKGLINTLDKVNAFAADNYQSLYKAGYLIDLWEQENDKALRVNMLKDLVNPCQRMVQKIKYAGLEREFSKAINGDGFDIDGWAYTCDKTVKALRVSKMTRGIMASILLYQKGVYDAYTSGFASELSDMQFASMQSVIEMYKAPMNDVLEVRKNRSELTEKIIKTKNYIGNAPIAILK